MSQAVRIIGIEYLQNLPVLLGLMIALSLPSLVDRAAMVAFGAFCTAATIALTEPIKMNRRSPERPMDLLTNTIAFTFGGWVYLAHDVLLRPLFAHWFIADTVIGALAGFVVGVVQALFVSTRRLDRESLSHAAALAVVGATLFELFGILRTLPALPAALLLCMVITGETTRAPKSAANTEQASRDSAASAGNH
jgi:hypothetical protein